MIDSTPNGYEACEKYAAACAIQHNAEPARSRADFYRFMARIKADALREAAAAVMGERLETETDASNWLDERADRIEEEP